MTYPFFPRNNFGLGFWKEWIYFSHCAVLKINCSHLKNVEKFFNNKKEVFQFKSQSIIFFERKRICLSISWTSPREILPTSDSESATENISIICRMSKHFSCTIRAMMNMIQIFFILKYFRGCRECEMGLLSIWIKSVHQFPAGASVDQY